MCTISWKTNSHGIRCVYFNRDELKTRPIAEPPQKFVSDSGVSYLAPIDPAGGGSWIAVNEHGILIALLNRWHEEHDFSGENQSRGKIVLELSDCRRVDEAGLRISDKSLHGYLPFTLVLLDSCDSAVFAWNGSRLISEEANSPITSSSFDFQNVRIQREAALAEGDPQVIHSGMNIVPSPYTVRMNRLDAQTWSRSEISFSATSVEWDYWKEMPDLCGEATLYQTSLTLDLPLENCNSPSIT